MSKIPIAVTIAGSDSGGGAGIQADLKSFSANRVYGASVLTALTAQNTKGVTAIQDIPTDFISAQIDAVFSDLDVDAVKIGMLSQIPVIETVAAGIEKHGMKNIVFDPVMVATSGDLLLAEDAIGAIKSVMLPLASLLTPNLHEAAKLTASTLADTQDEMIRQAETMLELGAKAILIKGGHGTGPKCTDLLMDGSGVTWFTSPRIDTVNTHGTGCSLSSAIAANLAHGLELSESVSKAKTWLGAAIASSGDLAVGSGAGPVHHFHELW